jgi:hypothetical protein
MKMKYHNINKKLDKLKERNTIDTQKHNHLLHQRVSNLSNTTFTDEEMTLLNKGLKYNLHHKQKHWLQTLAIETDTAINLIDPHEQTYVRQTVARKLKTLISKDEKTQQERQITRQ